MLKTTNPAPPASILYSCYHARQREGEQFVARHIFGAQLAGTLVLNNGQQTYTFQPGDFRFCRRNQLIKYDKQPPPQGEFQSVSISFDQETLRGFSLEYGYQAGKSPAPVPGIVALPPTARLTGFLDSLRPYDHLHQPGNELLQALKMKEALLVLLQSHPELAQVLFDFSEPGKLDLEAFMQQHFHFNVGLSRFAYLTGRSLATFKRDFERIFRLSPRRWLQQRRLQEAYFLIKERGWAPSAVYLEVGFEDLSHFSFAFKQAYGVAPSRL